MFVWGLLVGLLLGIPLGIAGLAFVAIKQDRK